MIQWSVRAPLFCYNLFMIIKSASQVGSHVIRAKARRVVDPKSKEVRKIVKDLIDTMRHHQLFGMAAPQIGQGLRIFVTEIRYANLKDYGWASEVDSVHVFINPKIVSMSKRKVSSWEGCGSVASSHLFGQLKRYESVTLEAFNEHGEMVRLKARGLLARIIQHEMDHLNGIVFTDTADPKTYMSVDEYLKMQTQKK